MGGPGGGGIFSILRINFNFPQKKKRRSIKKPFNHLGDHPFKTLAFRGGGGVKNLPTYTCHKLQLSTEKQTNKQF
jgi:hypothetical protein